MKKEEEGKYYSYFQEFFNMPIKDLLDLLFNSTGFKFDVSENKIDHFHWITLENLEPDNDGFEVNIKFIEEPRLNRLYSLNSAVEFEMFDVDGTYKGGSGTLLAVINIITKTIGDVRALEKSLIAKKYISNKIKK